MDHRDPGVPSAGQPVGAALARPYLIERVEDAAVVQLYADGFSSLGVREKTFVYYLYLAAIVGRDIYYDQRYGQSLEMRALLEQIVTHPSDVHPPILEAIEHYLKLFWLNSGPHNSLTARKFVLEGCTGLDLHEAALRAADRGAAFSLRPGESLGQLVARLEPAYFDPDVDATVTSKSPRSGQDILSASSNNLYSGVALADLAGFEERFATNSRLVKRDGKLIEQAYRVGGLYGYAIEMIIGHLREAIRYAPAPTAAALQALIRFYQTGERADREAYDIAWVRDKDSPVDTINGFVEVYMDARGTKAAWESLVFYVNREKTDAIRTIARHAQWFEDHMPWDPRYRKDGVTGVSANAIDVVVETGDSGPCTPIGINLPNDERIRMEYGSKSVSLTNVMEAYDRSMPASYYSEFSWTAAEAARARTWSSFASELTTNMHEVIGHASGVVDPRLQAPPQAALCECYSTLEEARADLVALHFLAHPKLAELGLVPAEHQEEIARAEYESYARNALVQLRRVKDGAQLEEDHMRNRQLVVKWLMTNTPAIRERHYSGRTFYVVEDVAAFQAGVAQLLAEVQRIKSQGDYAAAQALVDTYAVHFDPALRDEVMARVRQINLASYTGFVMPRLEPIKGNDGSITDIAISYPLDLKAQMLEYARMSPYFTRTTAVRGADD